MTFCQLPHYILSFVILGTASLIAEDRAPLFNFCVDEVSILGRAKFRPDSVESGGDGQVFVTDLNGQLVRYERTDRSLDSIMKHVYPLKYLDPAKLAREKTKVLDLSCGNGSCVEGLRQHFVDAVGIDIHLTDSQRTKPYFYLRDAANTGFQDNHFDVIYSTDGVVAYRLFYGLAVNDEMKEQIRILKPNGLLFLSTVSSKQIDRLDFKELEFVHEDRKTSRNMDDRDFVVYRKRASP
jgi:SAM-dependent methyltransferase